MQTRTPWRLGIDLGTNSLGWAALELNHAKTTPIGIVASGVRIFSDGRNPKDKQSNAAKRREPRSARKNRDRAKRRTERLMRELTEFKLMPTDPSERKKLEGGKHTLLEDTDPWILRYRALNEEISLFQLGRAIFHLHQRRGFKSNRKTDRADSESGKVFEATQRTSVALEENDARTLGELFGHSRYEAACFNKTAPKGERKPQPLARVRKSGSGSKWQYDYYPTRALIMEEFHLIWEAQKKYHPEVLTDEAYARLADTIEWQHPLKAQPVGRCTLLPEEERAAKAYPVYQRARILQEVNALRVSDAGKAEYALSIEQRNKVVNRLITPTSKTGKVTFKQLKKLLGLEADVLFNLESDKRQELQGDETAAKLMQPDRWGLAWLELTADQQHQIVYQLLHEENEEALIKWLCNTWELSPEQAYQVSNCPLPDGHGRLSLKALEKIVPALENDVIVYSEAVERAGLGSHSQFATGEIFDDGLPYYGYILERSVAFGSGDPNDPDEKRYGKVANPTVHVALNQIRAVVNDLMRRFGTPEEIVVELARDLPLSAKRKSELEKLQRENQDANNKRREILDELGVQDSYENRMRLRLYEDLKALDKCCPFSGEPISLTNLFSDRVEVEHILPFSITFDDSYGNKTLATRKANRDKGKKAPYDAFGHSPNGYDWQAIADRATELPYNKRWRFSPDALKRYTEFEGGFLARQLTDTQYISRLTKSYLEALYGGQGYKGAKNRVRVIPGRLTADLRHEWGLNAVLRGHNEPEAEAQRKNRNDHRHHAIDAIVAGCTDQRLVQHIATQAKKNEDNFSEKLMAGIAEPWEGFREDVEQSVRDIIVSHQPDHGIQAAMHNDTAYGIPKGEEGQPDKKGVRTVVTRKPLDSDSFKKQEDLEKIRDPDIREHLMSETAGLTGNSFKEALLAAGNAMSPPVYKIRIEEKLRVIPMKDTKGKEYKSYKGDGNYCYDIWKTNTGKWTGEVISTFQAYQLARKDENWWQKPVGQQGQKLLMRLRKNDYLKIHHENRDIIVQVVKFTDGTLALAEHMEANVDARVRDKDDELKFIFKSPSSLQNANAVLLTVSPSGVSKSHQIRE
ncbi:type II CRISPR RNA-guided endonuclease Cas9 [Sneathiella limimaris]|uniref:type II CRISPR RNA-guided endonuclease Cas9 n=1 Tax=Sneathiella limimaris TaxID=1964213 RepID=UPI00146D1460|nr:type II CRISPR RNA-guided endonuclease Cas9 [Sneathiella limimaris]